MLYILFLFLWSAFISPRILDEAFAYTKLELMFLKGVILRSLYRVMASVVLMRADLTPL